MKRNRHHDRERADVLDEGGQDGHRDKKQQHLAMQGGECGKKPFDREIDHAGPGHTRTDHQSTADDDDEVVGEAGKGFAWRNQAHGDCRDQCAAGDHIVADFFPHECRHHDGDDTEGEGLLVCHRVPA